MRAPRTITLGELDQRVMLQRPPTDSDTLGERAGVWTDVEEVWAKINPLRTGQRFAASQAGSSTDHTVVIRYRTDIDSTWRLVHNGQPIEIDGDPIDVESRGEWLEMNGIKGVRDGR